jgi:hypothetical protein
MRDGAQIISTANSTIRRWRPELGRSSDASHRNGDAAIMIPTQPVPPRRYNATGVAAQNAQDAGHCRTSCPRCNSSVVRIDRRFIDHLALRRVCDGAQRSDLMTWNILMSTHKPRRAIAGPDRALGAIIWTVSRPLPSTMFAIARTLR